MIDRAKFFAGVRASPFGGSMTQGQVTGLSAILDAAPVALPLAHLAYCLATTFHETARTMLPIKEYGGTIYLTRMYDIRGDRPEKARELGNEFPGDGAKFCGRGYVQLTGRSNYARAAGITGANLLDAPDDAMRPEIAARIMFEGMGKGWFTGKKLSDYFGLGKDDPVNARRIINGLDKASDIAGYHRAFMAALRAADAPAVTAPVPALSKPAPATVPAPAPVPVRLVEKPTPGFFASILRGLSALNRG